MALTGPDFQNARNGMDDFLLPKYGEVDHWVLFPQALGIASRTNKGPDFQLDLVRSPTGDTGYGVLDFRVKPITDLAGAKNMVGTCVLETGAFTDGWLRLLIREPGSLESTTVLPPVRVASNGLGIARLAAQLSPLAGSLLKRALLEKTVLLEAWAEMCIAGVSPREDSTVEISVSDVADRLRGVASDSPVTRSALIEAIKTHPALASLSVAGWQAVADRLFQALGQPVSSPTLPAAEYWLLDLTKTQRRFRWDLAEPVEARRRLLIRFDPIDLLEKSANTNLNSLVVLRELPEFQTGFQSLLVSANLLDNRSTILSCGVDIVAPPQPPTRLGAIHETVEFAPPQDRKELVLHYAPGEAFDYQMQTFVIAQTDQGIKEWRLPAIPRSGADLRLSEDDFGARFIPVTGSPDLLLLGPVRVTARWPGATQTLGLDLSNPSDTFAIDRSSTDLTFEISLKSGSRQVRKILPFTAAPLSLDLNTFAEYGSHTINVEIDFADGPAVLALEFAPEEEDGNGTPTPLSFTPERPQRTWTWFSRSPFAPGFRFRSFTLDGSSRWSDPQSPFTPLKIRAKDFVV